jgi:uncharacterized membrane protein
MQPWLIPMLYVVGAVAGGLVLPRIEHAWQTDAATQAFELSVSSAQAYLSAAASGMMALTGIVFAMGFVMVQFSSIAYSPRLVLWFARDRMLFHALGAFSATFIFALATLAWVDRAGSGMVPPFSCGVVGVLIVVSMLMFSRLMQRLSDLQISNVLRLIGDEGRVVIARSFGRLNEHPAEALESPRDLPARLHLATRRSNRYRGRRPYRYFRSEFTKYVLGLRVVRRLRQGPTTGYTTRGSSTLSGAVRRGRGFASRQLVPCSSCSVICSWHIAARPGARQ